MTIPDNFDTLNIPDQISALMRDAGARRFEIQTARLTLLRQGGNPVTLDFIDRDRREALGIALEVRRLRRNGRISNSDARAELARGAELMREIHRQRPNWKVRP